VAAKQAARQRLIRNAGLHGTDAEGLQLDRREFAETKAALNWLAVCQAGWYRREGERDAYRVDLMDVVNDFLSRGLPADHGITMRVRRDGRAWYAYRRTPSGYYFAIGASGPPPSQWYYNGSHPPRSYPRPSQGWSTEAERPEWRKEDEI
jgi:hypothetical protein